MSQFFVKYDQQQPDLTRVLFDIIYSPVIFMYTGGEPGGGCDELPRFNEEGARHRTQGRVIGHVHSLLGYRPID